MLQNIWIIFIFKYIAFSFNFIFLLFPDKTPISMIKWKTMPRQINLIWISDYDSFNIELDHYHSSSISAPSYEHINLCVKFLFLNSMWFLNYVAKGYNQRDTLIIRKLFSPILLKTLSHCAHFGIDILNLYSLVSLKDIFHTLLLQAKIYFSQSSQIIFFDLESYKKCCTLFNTSPFFSLIN